MGKQTGKNRIYTGQLVTSENYSNFSKKERDFWNKAHKSFLQGKMYFTHNGVMNVVPFRFADGSFDTVLTAEKYNELLDKKSKEKEDGTTERPTDGGQSEPADRMAPSIV